MENNPANITVNNLEPCNLMFTMWAPDKLFTQFGGILAKQVIESYQYMSIEDFKKEELDKLNNGDMLVLTDMSTNQYIRITADGVIKFKIKNIEEVFCEDMIKHIQSTNRVRSELVFNMTAKLISYVEDEKGFKKVVAAFPSKGIQYQNTRLLGDFEPVIYVPPVWLIVNMGPSNSIGRVALVVVKDRELKLKDTKMYHWPLSNVYTHNRADDCSICFGQTTSNIGTMIENPSIGDLVQGLYDRFFGGQSNLDLVPIVAKIDALYAKYPEIPEIKKLLESSRQSYSGMLKTIRVLMEPTGWRNIEYTQIHDNAEEMVRRIN